MDSIELLLRTSQFMDENRLLWEIEKTTQLVRKYPDVQEHKNAMIVYCMLYLSKKRLEKGNIEDILKEISQKSTLHDFFSKASKN